MSLVLSFFGDQEQSAKEEDSIVELGSKRDAETVSQVQALKIPHSMNARASTIQSQTTAVAHPEAAINGQTASSHRDSSLEGESAVTSGASRHRYPPEYNPFDRPVGEVVAQLFDDTQPVNPPLLNDSAEASRMSLQQGCHRGVGSLVSGRTTTLTWSALEEADPSTHQQVGKCSSSWLLRKGRL